MTTTRLRRKIDMFIFCSRRMEGGASDTSLSDRSRVAVESNAYHNFDHFHRSRMRRGIVVS